MAVFMPSAGVLSFRVAPVPLRRQIHINDIAGARCSGQMQSMRAGSRSKPALSHQHKGVAYVALPDTGHPE